MVAKEEPDTHRLTIESRGETSVIICSQCQRPFFEIANGQIRLLAKHGGAQHENVLTFKHFRLIGSVMYQQLHPPERW